MVNSMSETARTAFASFPEDERQMLTRLRATILKTAAAMEPAIEVVEELKWGQLSCRPKKRTGTPVRIGTTKAGSPALFVHCATSLIEDWAEDCHQRGTAVAVEGTRALIVDPDDPDAAAPFISRAFQYYI